MIVEQRPVDPLPALWDRRYADAGEGQVTWYQKRPEVSLDLVALGAGYQSDAMIDVGGGASRLVDHLCADGWSDITVLDVSEQALAIARNRLGVHSGGVRWLRVNLWDWVPDRRYQIWHDRAVFHFLVEEDDRRRYRKLLVDGLAADGLLAVGTFAKDGPTHCSGLPVARYDHDELLDALGGGFDVLAKRHEEHRTPTGGVQPFTWLALRKHSGPSGASEQTAVDRMLAEARVGIDRVEPQHLAAEVAAGALVVDIRPLYQRSRDGPIHGAFVVERHVLEWRLDPEGPHHLPEVRDAGQRIIVVCNGGFSSSLAAASLRTLGLYRATDLIGGFQALRTFTERA
ncbi:MAG: rhodanese-like domain-containing protein [Candidatus Nanopelagicales bacterium]